ncbi:hypothetical protein [Clostridium saccharoperbutylacetonicum]|uniref:hypothetical protein n=1 Tax=Clostridium saccharoperbutylacetonicum TaxID=36745 RepID=UPI000983ACEB|nr:hypothetical protein [Clostridium saccharoperbutylacetonicum]AQR95887.1 elongation factor Tu [Clostridium saccharoperbutylacetonicum]NSB31751.1 selenocysteine-specific translation elongation factor [Clostridium saccharoperbutylacetonicum]
MGVLSKLFGKKSKLQSKDLASIYTLLIDEIFTIKNLGCSVVGMVRGADIRVNEEVDVVDANGNRLASKIKGMEHPKVGNMDVAHVGILLTNIEEKQLHKSDVLTNEKIN